MKIVFWTSQIALVCATLYFSPLLSPVISRGWDIDEWSVRYSHYRDCISRKYPKGSSGKNLRRTCNTEAYGLPFFPMPDGKHEEIIDYNEATFRSNLRP